MGRSVKALTVKHPWAWAIINGGKDVENRSQRTNYRGRLYIHAGKTLDFDAFSFPPLQAAEREYHSRGLKSLYDETNKIDLSTTGMVLGTVDLIDCHPATDCADWAETGSSCSEWALADHWHWVLGNPRPLACPFPEKGKLGIWNLAGMP